jgi:transposase
MKAVPDRRYTPEFRDAAVRQVVEGGRSVAAVARSLEMSNRSLGNWVNRARKGQEAVKRAPARPASELETELSRLRQENAKLKLEKEILKNRLRGWPRPRWIETCSAYTVMAPGQRPLAFWRHSSPSKNLAQGKLRTQLWWHLA